jgi:predicted phage terminase large subunit-like protein
MATVTKRKRSSKKKPTAVENVEQDYNDGLENISMAKAMRIYANELVVERNDARTDFLRFVQYINRNYQTQWFHAVIAHKCQDVIEGRCKNLMIFAPPQHGKSELISRQLPAWALGVYPSLKIVAASYSSDLSQQFSRSIQQTLASDEYKAVFADTEVGGKGYSHTLDMFEINGARGFYKAVGVMGGLTGTPADIAIIDDPVKDAMEANSPTYRERVWDWYNSVLLTRLHNNSRQLFIMTRWHDDDLAGRILKREPQNWEVLSIPAICEQDNDGSFKSGRKVGDALWPQRHSLERLLAAQARAPRFFSALYQQHPSVDGGNIIKREWFRFISKHTFEIELEKSHATAHFFIDTAYTENIKNDPTGIIGAVKIVATLYVFAARQVRMKFPDLCRWLPVFVRDNHYSFSSRVCIEPKANGISVIDQLRESTQLNVVPTPTPRDSKETRLNAVSPFVESGRVCIVEGDFNEAFIDEITGFPAKEHDEFVDLLCYAINDTFNDDVKGMDATQLIDFL